MDWFLVLQYFRPFCTKILGKCTFQRFMWNLHFKAVFLNRCAAAHLCAVSSSQVCRQIFFPYFAYSFFKKSSFCQIYEVFLGIRAPPIFFLTLVCRELKKVENHCFKEIGKEISRLRTISSNVCNFALGKAK